MTPDPENPSPWARVHPLAFVIYPAILAVMAYGFAWGCWILGAVALMALGGFF